MITHTKQKTVPVAFGSTRIPSLDLIDPVQFHSAVKKMRIFFDQKGFIEVPVQHRLSILAACEDPRTISTYNYAGTVWPLPQTGQMWLEYELLTKPETPGFYCISTSYREEPNPLPGRHNLIFPMFEFETHGGIDTLVSFEKELLAFLGFGGESDVKELSYTDALQKYGVKEIEDEQERQMEKDYGPFVLLTHFPQYTSPFWNMKKVGDKANKVDVILYGMETIGSAERSTDPHEMRELFHTISNGMYADILYARFGKERVEKELENFLSLEFFPRFGGGIGMTRMIRAMKLEGVL